MTDIKNLCQSFIFQYLLDKYYSFNVMIFWKTVGIDGGFNSKSIIWFAVDTKMQHAYARTLDSSRRDTQSSKSGVAEADPCE